MNTEMVSYLQVRRVASVRFEVLLILRCDNVSLGGTSDVMKDHYLHSDMV